MEESTAAPSIFSPPGNRSAMRRRPARSSSRSPPRQHPTDALLCVLSPATAVETLRAPSGVLKACLDEASPFEQHFAVRTAIASRKIHDWLDELSDWPWPQGSTSAGFQPPPAKRRKLFEPREPEEERQDSPETTYLGSLPAQDVARYETRVDEIQKGMDDLDLEDIKSHVLLNHIMPLSRPGSPFSDSGHSGANTISFTKMQDISAVITAITVQSLPQLAKLSGLLNTWSVRIVVLRKVPSVLMMIADAEVALQSGWAAIKVDPHGLSPVKVDTAVLSRDDFTVMNSVLQQKVSDPGQDLDAMLDVLEGMVDTLPDEWLDRMDAVERDYADWAATAEQRVQEGENSRSDLIGQPTVVRPKQQTPRPTIQIRPPSPAEDLHEDLESSAISSPTEERLQAKNSRDSSRESVDEVPEVSDQDAQPPRALANEPSFDDVSDERPDEIHADNELFHANEPEKSSFDGSFEEQTAAQEYERGESGCALSELDHNVVRASPAGTLEPSPLPFRKGLLETDAEFSSFLESVHEEDEEFGSEPELPLGRFVSRRGSPNSIASVAVHDANSSFSVSDVGPSREQSVDLELPRLPDPDEPFSSDGLSPPSSPPLTDRQQSVSTSFNDMPEISELPEDEAVTPPRSPPPYPDTIDLDAPFDYGTQTQASSPGRSVFSEGGDDLHRQIREVLKNLPNKIRLSTKPAINLNPPDLQLPTLSSLSSSRGKGKTSDPYRRSASAMSARSTMSSRASNHTWLLAPARAPLSQSRASPEVKTYYLSRSAGEAPMKLLVRCVGEHGERVMVRVGGGWADLGEYLKEYAIHHSRRSRGEGKVEVKDSTSKHLASRRNSSSSSRPASALERPVTPLMVRKTRRSMDNVDPSRVLPAPPETPMEQTWEDPDTPPSDRSDASHVSRAVSNPNSSFLGMSGPHPKNRRVLSEESRQWVEDVKNKVRSASGGQRPAPEPSQPDSKFANMGKVGGTKRLYRKNVA